MRPSEESSTEPPQLPQRLGALRTVAVCLAVVVIFAGVVLVRPRPAPRAPRGGPTPGFDPALVVGPDACVECHGDEGEVWRATGHYTGARSLTRDAKAKEIADALGIRRIKSEERCAACHYTLQGAGDDASAVAGVSCESCHGPAHDWLDLHDDLGAGVATAREEEPAHRAARLERSASAGMHAVGDLVGLARRCWACHGFVDAELADAGHPLGGDLELVRDSQGALRHNFVRGAGANARSAPERLRAMYVTGRLADLEQTLRALDGAPPGGALAAAARARLAELAGAIEGFRAGCDHPALALALDLARDPGPDVAAAALRANEALRAFAREARVDGLASLDPMLAAHADGER